MSFTTPVHLLSLIETADVLESVPVRPTANSARVQVAGKFFRRESEKWYVRGLTYGPFSPGADGQYLPDAAQAERDLTRIHEFGGNALRLYHVPPIWFLDLALAHDIRVLIDVPWEKHRCFFEDWSAQEAARTLIRQTAGAQGRHPAVFAISVVNELPNDVVRFYGPRRVSRFVDELLQIVKHEAPECLATFANYPRTEFLTCHHADFECFNVYLHDPARLGAYLGRLQHLAGNKPLILGEHGIDSIRQGVGQQAAGLVQQIDQISQHGLAGSFVFSYTDDWFTGGRQVLDWGFGVTTRERNEKPAAEALQFAWSRRMPHQRAAPKVSVIVCTYNGAATLAEALQSLDALDYPNFEVLLIDDGSTDDTPKIAALFPKVHYVRQPNLGLSEARNVGARMAEGAIVAYTDDDCIVDADWLTYLVDAMEKQQVQAIGGPNIPPPSDSWVAKCVAASPGGPGHVMLDDQLAEHVPGCNMAFQRDRLLALGGFDPQFRQAGDDVDICWRLADAEIPIGFAAGAFVWHKRRRTVRAYLRQQKGYGQAEAMLRLKHPQRFNRLGSSRWLGVIYGDDMLQHALASPVIYHGTAGAGLFQSIYRNNHYTYWTYFTLLEWHLLAVAFLIGGFIWLPLILAPLLMWTATLLAAGRAAHSLRATLPPRAPWWTDSLIMTLHLLQPISRAWHRYRFRFGHKQLPAITSPGPAARPSKIISRHTFDFYWDSDTGRGREELLPALTAVALARGWSLNQSTEWSLFDLTLAGDLWHDIQVHSATEVLGERRCFTRARCRLRRSSLTAASCTVVFVWIAAASLTRHWIPAIIGAAALLLLMLLLCISRFSCRRAVASLMRQAATDAQLEARTPAPSLLPAHPEITGEAIHA